MLPTSSRIGAKVLFEDVSTDFLAGRQMKNCAGCWGRCFSAGKKAPNPRLLFRAARRRLVMCKLMLQKPNFLIFDEPTNHLDPESINALNIVLQRYEGTVLLVTHD